MAASVIVLFVWLQSGPYDDVAHPHTYRSPIMNGMHMHTCTQYMQHASVYLAAMADGGVDGTTTPHFFSRQKCKRRIRLSGSVAVC